MQIKTTCVQRKKKERKEKKLAGIGKIPKDDNRAVDPHSASSTFPSTHAIQCDLSIGRHQNHHHHHHHHYRYSLYLPRRH